MDKKRKLAQDKILEIMDTIDPSGTNSARYSRIFENMSDTDFTDYLTRIKDGADTIKVMAPNMKIALQQRNLLEACNKLDLNLFEKISLYDDVTGKTYLTPLEYMIVKLPVRRTKQYLMHKLSVPESDKRIDNVTGQVIKPDRSSGMSYVEAQLLYSRGLTNTLTEYMKVRGGDVNTFASYKQQLEETGQFDLNSIDPNSVNRSAVVTSSILKCMYFDNNLVE